MDSSRITIRPFEISDAEDFIMFAGDEKVTRFTRWNAFATKEQALAYIRETCIPHPFCRSICVDDRSVGYISVTPSDDRSRGEVGYALAAEYWGRGITTVALRMVISQVFVDLPQLVRLQALVQVENKGSQRVLDKLGFLREALLRRYAFNKGEVKDVFIYSLLRTDPVF